MREPHPFFIVDVFAEAPYAGNQLGVITRAADISSGEMQQIARETNFAETTFVLADEAQGGGFDVRIFTPRAELPFAGHPTLGTAWVIRKEILGEPREEVVLNLKVGPIPVTFEPADDAPPVLWMRQLPPRFGAEPPRAAAAAALGLAEDDLDPRFPVQEVSTGIGAVIVPVRSLAAVRRARLEREACARLVEPLEAKVVHFFCQEALEDGNHLHVRVFADHYGVPEDAATGSANGCLAGYLVEHRVRGEGPIDLRVEQGHSIGRPSLLRLRAERDEDGQIAVRVGGRVVPTVRGELL